MSKAIARRGARRLAAISTRWSTAHALRRASPSARRVLEPLHYAARYRLAADEASRVAQLENRRAELEASGEPMGAADFGDQSPDAIRRRVAAGGHEGQTVGTVCRATSKSPRSALFLMKLCARGGARRSLELGTSLGISGAYQAAGLEAEGGSLVTLEGDAARAAIARRTFEALGLDRINVIVGLFHDTLGAALDGTEAFDTVFVDGHHDGPATIAYHERILPHLAPDAIVVFDDIGWSSDMAQAWRTLSTRPEFAVAVDCGRFGACVRGARDAGAPVERFTVPATWL